jgi:hypothetical protein
MMASIMKILLCNIIILTTIVSTDQKCQKISEEFNYCVWEIYLNDDLNSRNTKEAAAAIAMLKQLDARVSNIFPNQQHVAVRRA